jgi:acyl carrier protein
VIQAIGRVKPAAVQAIKPGVLITQLGLDSIEVVELLAELEERSGAILPMELLARGVTINELVYAISLELDRAS